VEFAISYNRAIKPIMVAILCGPRRSRVRLDPDHLVVEMGARRWAWWARVPRTAIKDATRISAPRGWGWGAHGWRGRWLVNGSGRGVVRMTIDPPTHARCLGVEVTLRELMLSLDEPDRFIEELSVATFTG
jgi:hypothetical protein